MISDSFWLMSRYRVKKDQLQTFIKLAKEHYPAARAAGFATSAPPQLWVADQDEDEPPMVIEVFEWTSSDALGSAHDHPEIGRIWGAMRPLFATEGDLPPREHQKIRAI